MQHWTLFPNKQLSSTQLGGLGVKRFSLKVLWLIDILNWALRSSLGARRKNLSSPLILTVIVVGRSSSNQSTRGTDCYHFHSDLRLRFRWCTSSAHLLAVMLLMADWEQPQLTCYSQRKSWLRHFAIRYYTSSLLALISHFNLVQTIFILNLIFSIMEVFLLASSSSSWSHKKSQWKGKKKSTETKTKIRVQMHHRTNTKTIFFFTSTFKRESSTLSNSYW